METMKRFAKTTAVAASIAAALSVGLFVGRATAEQTHMDNALGYLESARSELQVAERNKGGHRAEALRLTNQAIDEVRDGIRYAE
jgi:hypothetical protein